MKKPGRARSTYYTTARQSTYAYPYVLSWVSSQGEHSSPHSRFTYSLRERCSAGDWYWTHRQSLINERAADIHTPCQNLWSIYLTTSLHTRCSKPEDLCTLLMSNYSNNSACHVHLLRETRMFSNLGFVVKLSYCRPSCCCCRINNSLTPGDFQVKIQTFG